MTETASKPDGPVRSLFEHLLDPDRQRRQTDGLYALFVAAACLTVIVFAANFAFGKQGEAGQWGDFFGGFLNPILTFITFMGVLITIVLQQRELRESREELKRSAEALISQNDVSSRQLFENTFFQMLTLHNNIVSSVDIHTHDGKVISGRDCFNLFLQRLSSAFKIVRRSSPELSGEELLEKAYIYYWRGNNSDLGHYYRYMYNIIRYVDENETSKPYHIKLIRAQLSDQETVLLFYNSLSSLGEKFSRYAEKYELFDNLRDDMLIMPEHASLVPRKVTHAS